MNRILTIAAIVLLTIRSDAATTMTVQNLTVVNLTVGTPAAPAEVNDAPVATNQSLTLLTNTALAITMTSSDVDGPSTNYTILTSPTNGNLSALVGSSITYTSGVAGGDMFTFRVSDGSLYATGTVTMTITNAPAPGGELASDGSVADVQAKLNSAVDGDTVTIPAGSFTWTSGVTLSGKAVTLQGAGGGKSRGSSTTSLAIGTGTKVFTVQAGLGFTAGQSIRAHYKVSIDSQYMTGTVTSYTGTTLTLNITSVTGSGTYAAWQFQQDGATIITYTGTATMFAVTEDVTGPVVVRDLHIVRVTGDAKIFTPVAVTSGKPAMLLSCRLDLKHSRAVEMASLRGVIADCDFKANDWSFTTINTTQCITMPSVSQDSWSQPSTLGTNDTGWNNLYVEGCTFFGFTTECVDMDGGSRVVFRYNTFDHSGVTSHGLDTGIYGIRQFEFYGNTFIHQNFGTSTHPMDYFLFIRGGTGVVVSNDLPNMDTSEYGDKAEIKMQIQNLMRNAGPFACWNSGWPAPRQVGMGRITGAGTTNGTYGYLGDSDPIYVWGHATAPWVVGQNYYTDECGLGTDYTTYIQHGRDYFTNGTAKPNWAANAYPHPLRP